MIEIRENMQCIVCNTTTFISTPHPRVWECVKCQIWVTDPQPTDLELKKFYSEGYFKKRENGGYNKYLDKLNKKSIINTLEKNLKQLKAFKWGPKTKNVLEIGCAAGYNLEYFKNLGWNETGLDISNYIIKEAKSKNLNVFCKDLENFKTNQKFDLIICWHTLEHLKNPVKILKTMKKLLKKNGKIYLSTVNTRFFARIYKKNWRYLCVPEHLYFFNSYNLKKLAKKCGLKITKTFTYGSGFTERENMSIFYKIAKKIFDFLAKFKIGDNIVLELQKL